jgi:hypothetical protein
VEDFNEYGCCVYAKCQLVGMLYLTLSFKREEHGAAMVDDELAAEVGLLLELLDVKAVGAAVETPVDVAGALSGVVLAIVGEFSRKAVEGAPVATGDEAFHDLTCEEV